MSTAEMPDWLERRQHALNVAARERYGLRNAAEHYGDIDKAQVHHDAGDVYFCRALAISAEWEEATR